MADLENQLVKCPLCSHHSKIEGLCQRCEARIHSQLDDLFELWDAAHGELTPSKGSGSGGRSSERTIGLNVNALSFIQGADILGILHEWEKFIRGALKLTPPALVEKQPTLAGEIDATIKFMQTHLRFLASTDYIEDFAQELTALHALGTTAAKKFTEKATRIACPADREDGLPCGWMLRITDEQKHDPLMIISCRACKSEWTTLRLVQVALSTKGAELWLDVETIAQWLEITPRQVQRLAKQHNVKKRGTLYDVVAMKNIRAKQ